MADGSIMRQLQHYLRRKKIDALIVSQPDNRRYLCGYSALNMDIAESSGILLVFAKSDPVLLTDFRYLEHAQNDTKDLEIVLYQRGMLQTLSRLLIKFSVTTLAFEPYYYLQSEYIKLSTVCSDAHIDLIGFSDYILRKRQQKSSDEIEAIQLSVSLNEQVFQDVYHTLRPGISELEVAIAIENAMRIAGAERPSFDTIVASGPNAALPHAVPTSRKIHANEPVIIDMGLVHQGYCSDMTRTVVLGDIDTKTRSIFRLVRKAQLAATMALKPGVACRIIDKSAREVIVEGGYGHQFGHALGHGVGLAVHEAPSLNKRNSRLLKPGMVVTIEPGIYLPGWGGVRLENMAVITDFGHHIFNHDDTFLNL